MSYFSHTRFGDKVRIVQYGREVHIIFTANTQAQSDNALEELARQFEEGAISIGLMVVPTSVEEL